MRRINNFDSIIKEIASIFPADYEVKYRSDYQMQIDLPYFPTQLSQRMASSICFSVSSFGERVITCFYFIKL